MARRQSPKGTPGRPSQERLRQRTSKLRREIAAMDFLVSGTLHTRTKVCGRPNCRCADDVNARHGPYYEWSRRQDGRLVHSVLTAEQSQLVTRALENYHRTLALLAKWESESTKEILNPDSAQEPESP